MPSKSLMTIALSVQTPNEMTFNYCVTSPKVEFSWQPFTTPKLGFCIWGKPSCACAARRRKTLVRFRCGSLHIGEDDGLGALRDEDKDCRADDEDLAVSVVRFNFLCFWVRVFDLQIRNAGNDDLRKSCDGGGDLGSAAA
ncbi:hypothetical protein LR48_Vigan02g044700 [Vigna angularis]|uniref:Uncharacterized protein n=1 Tax=Phaseolus angularis TaxID=3914 RepID=A0A0L9TV55_PHAAN|nr:hypothetical protein LR48_Vigan02g044700 [Vigna angularis]